MTDKFIEKLSLRSPATQRIEIDYSGGDVDLSAQPTRKLHCNVAGDINVVFSDDVANTEAVVMAVLAGVTYPWRIKKVLQASSTATVVGLI